MKFFPVSSATFDTSAPQVNTEFFGRVLRFNRDSGAGISLVRFVAQTGTIQVLLDTEKPMYFLIPEGSIYRYYRFSNISGSCIVNVSESPYIGDDPNFIKFPLNSGIGEASASPTLMEIKSGKVRVFREKNGVQTYIAFNSTATANSVELVDDETFFVPDGTFLSGYAASATNLSWANV